MTSEELVIAVIDALNALSVPYMLVGSFSSSYYGIPRSSQDADFVVEFNQSSASALISQLAPIMRVDPQMSFETITGTWRYVATAEGAAFKIEFFLLSDDLHDRERFLRRRRVPLLGRHLYVPSPEDVIITKLRWSLRGKRHKDIDDVRNVIAVQSAVLDWTYIENWCDRHETRELLEQIRASIPPNL